MYYRHRPPGIILVDGERHLRRKLPRRYAHLHHIASLEDILVAGNRSPCMPLPPIVDLEGGRNSYIQTAMAPPLSDPTPKKTDTPAGDFPRRRPATKWQRPGRRPGRVPNDPYRARPFSPSTKYLSVNSPPVGSDGNKVVRTKRDGAQHRRRQKILSQKIKNERSAQNCLR